MDDTADAVIVMDLDGRIVDWPSSAEALFGWTREEAVGRLAVSLLIPDRFRDAFNEGLEADLAASSDGPSRRTAWK